MFIPETVPPADIPGFDPEPEVPVPPGVFADAEAGSTLPEAEDDLPSPWLELLSMLVKGNLLEEEVDPLVDEVLDRFGPDTPPSRLRLRDVLLDVRFRDEAGLGDGDGESRGVRLKSCSGSESELFGESKTIVDGLGFA